MAIQFSCKYATWRPFNRPRHCRALQSCSFGHIAFHARSRFRLSVTNYACLVFPRYSYVGTRSCSHTLSLSFSPSLPLSLSLSLPVSVADEHTPVRLIVSLRAFVGFCGQKRYAVLKRSRSTQCSIRLSRRLCRRSCRVSLYDVEIACNLLGIPRHCTRGILHLIESCYSFRRTRCKRPIVFNSKNFVRVTYRAHTEIRFAYWKL